MEVPPLISALLRNKTGPILVALQVAITLAVAVNALYLITLRIEVMRRPTGMDVANIFWGFKAAPMRLSNHRGRRAGRPTIPENRCPACKRRQRSISRRSKGGQAARCPRTTRNPVESAWRSLRACIAPTNARARTALGVTAAVCERCSAPNSGGAGGKRHRRQRSGLELPEALAQKLFRWLTMRWARQFMDRPDQPV